MNVLTCNQISKSYTDKILFNQVNFGLEENEKVGIIGINGTGKSTLLKMLAGLEECDSGEIIKGNNVFINYLPQNPEFKKGDTIYHYVVEANKTHDNEWTIEGDAKTILNKLGFNDYSLVLDTLSGGQKKKVALAATLLSGCEILILDEPTNHLDYEMTSWLEDYLKQYKGACIMVTHDRYFLDRVCNRIVEIDHGNLFSYNANYEGYLFLKAERENMDLATQRKHQSILRKELEWIKRGARARSTKQKARIERYETLKNEELIQGEKAVEINTLSSRLGKKTIEVDGLCKSFGNTVFIKDFSYIFLRDDKIGIVGPNGCGKSTLLKLISKQIIPDAGTVEIGDTIHIGYFSQENDLLDEKTRVIDYIRETAEYITTVDGSVSASQMLERFLFDSTLQYSLIGKLSGGEKRRLYLLKVLMESPNVLILDEPTNDLDIQTLCILEDFLDTFPGILITVSHDRYFLDRVTNRLFIFEKNESIKLFEGSYSEYIPPIQNDSLKKETQIEKTEKIKTKKLKFTYQEQKDYDSIEYEIEQLEEKIQKLDTEMLQASTDFIELNRLSNEKITSEQLLDEKMERYIYLTDLKEQIEHQ